MIKKILIIGVCIIIISSAAIPIALSSNEGNLAVVVIEGQSNAAYWGYGVSLMNEKDPIPEHNVYYYGDSDGPIFPGNYDDMDYDTTFSSYGIHSMIENNAWKVGTSDAAIAYEIQKRYNVDVLVINAGVNGASISWLKPGQPGGNYITEVVRHALNDAAHYGKIIRCGFVWIQGEADYNTSIDSYEISFNKIMELNESLGFSKCYMVQTKPANSGNAATAQLQICQTVPGVILASTAPSTFTVENGLLIYDNIHYSAEGRYIVGVDVGDKVSLNNPTDLLIIVPIFMILAVALFAMSMWRKERWERRKGKD